jgi:anti-anti-sigma factor
MFAAPASRTLRVAGTHDITAATPFADDLDQASRGGVDPMTLDLTNVDILASAGVRLLFRLRDQYATHGHDLLIHTTPSSVASDVLDLVGLPHQLAPESSGNPESLTDRARRSGASPSSPSAHAHALWWRPISTGRERRRTRYISDRQDGRGATEGA